MCLNSFARYEGLGFLSLCLKEPLEEIITYISDVELDPNRLKENYTPEIVRKNEQLIQKACLTIIKSISANRHQLPLSIRRSCHFLRVTIQQAVSKSNEGLTSQSRPSLPAISETDLISRHSSTEHSLAEKNGNNKLQQSQSSQHQQQPPLSSSRTNTSLTSRTDSTPSSSYAPTTTLPTATPTPSTLLHKDSTNSIPEKTKGGRISSVKIDENNKFAVVEKVISSFLFLRFLIPPITTPETYGILPGPITVSQRRGLLLCGKIMTGLCNDVDFGHKEEHLQSMNTFLRQNRHIVKDFIQFVTQDVSNYCLFGDFSVALLTKSFKKNQPIAAASPPTQHALLSEQHESPDKMVTPASSAAASPVSSPVETDFGMERQPSMDRAAFAPILRSLGVLGENRDQLFVFFGKNITKIEKTLLEDLSRLTMIERDGVDENFAQFKKCLEASCYHQPINPHEQRGSVMMASDMTSFQQNELAAKNNIEKKISRKDRPRSASPTESITSRTTAWNRLVGAMGKLFGKKN